MDQDFLKGLAQQGVFAVLFGYLGQRQLKQSDRLQEQNDKMIAQLLELIRQGLEREKAFAELVQKISAVLDRVTERLNHDAH